MKLEDRVAIITGAGRGVGRGIALSFAREGASVALAARTKEEIDEVAWEIDAAGGEVLAVKADVTQKAQVAKLVERVTQDLGGVDILVNNAGVFLEKPLVEIQESEWDRVLSTNLKSYYLCTKAVMPVMMKQKGGCIINISSIYGKFGQENFSAHCAAEFGVIGLTQALARELRPYNIAVNAVCPGAVDNRSPVEQWKRESPLHEKLRPSDIGNLCVWLGSRESAHITGAAIDVFGNVDFQLTVLKKGD